MNQKKINFYPSFNKKYKLVRVTSRIISPIVLLTSLTGCVYKNNDFNNNRKNNNYNNYSYTDKYNIEENVNDFYYSPDGDKPVTNNANNNANNNKLDTNLNDSNDNKYDGNNKNNKVEDYKENINKPLILDDYSLQIINKKVKLNQNSINLFVNYIKGINVSYTYNDIYNTNLVLNKYNSLGKYNSTSKNLFINNNISSETLYSIVKKNNSNEKLVAKATLSDSELREICSIIVGILNDYAKNYKKADLLLLSEKINNLKILKFDDFSNGYFDATNGRMGFNVTYLKNKSYDFYKKTIEHETYHFIEGNSIGESTSLGFVDRYGFSYEFLDVNVNSLLWNWYYEGSAEYLACNYNNTRENNVYDSVIKSIDTVKVATILSNKNKVATFERLSLSNDLNDLFEYFGCETKEDKIEVLNLMYSYNIIYNMNFSSDDFYKQYELIYGSKANKRDLEKELNNNIAQTLTKYFYRDLAILINNKEIDVKDIFSLISVFENEISREIWYNSNQDTLDEFFDVYNGIQSNFFDILSRELGIKIDDLQYAYNAYNKCSVNDISNISILENSKKEFYNYITKTRKNDKMNSINYVSEKYNNKTK